MKKQLFFAITLILSISLSSCKKDDKKEPEPEPAPAPAPAPPANQLFINFTLDGAAKSYTSTDVSLSTGYGGGSFTSTGFFNLKQDIHFTLSMPLDSIMGSDLQALVGQKLVIGSCGGCPTNIHFDFDLNGNDYESYDSNNDLPNEYIKFNSVTFHKNVTVFGKNLNQYYVTGEFNLKVSSGTDIKNATNGTFGLLFRESKH